MRRLAGQFFGDSCHHEMHEVARRRYPRAVNKISENGTVNPPREPRRLRPYILAGVILAILVAALLMGRSYFTSHSAKLMHSCWDGTESEICPPSGVSQGNP